VDSDKPTVQPWSRLLIEKVPFFLLAGVASIITIMVQQRGGAFSSLEAVPFPLRLANAALAYVRYISKTFVPTDLAIIYPYPHWPIWLAAAAALLLAVFCALCLAAARRFPYLLTGWLWFIGTLVPTIGIVQVGSQSMADRYMYIPSIGLFILLVWGVDEVLTGRPFRKPAIAIFATLAFADCLVGTRLQLRHWYDGETLWTHAIEVTTDNYIAYNGLGPSLEEKGRLDEAIQLYAKSVSIDSHYPEGQYNLGTALMAKGRFPEAEEHLRAALALNPNYAQARVNLGQTLLKQGKLDEAATHLARAVVLEPEDAEAHYDYGTVLLHQNKTADAITEFGIAIRLKPNYAIAHGNLAVALMSQGRIAEGTAEFTEALKLEPLNPEAHFNLGLALANQNRFQEAASRFNDALKLRPADPRSHFQLGQVLVHLRQPAEAVAHFREAIRLRPEWPPPIDALARLLASDPDPAVRNGSEAVQLAQSAVKLSESREPQAILTLAMAQAETGAFTDAVSSVGKARDIAAGRKDILSQCDDLEKLFQSHQPYHARQ
jgi:tetratricopeptide (TPR) repeat protein